MFTEIQEDKISGRLSGYKVTTSASAATVNLGVKDITSARSAAGKAVNTFAEPFLRAPVVVGSPVGTVTAGTFFRASAVSTLAAFTSELRTAAGAGEEGAINALVHGWDSEETDFVSRVSGLVNTNGLEPVLLGLSINGSGDVVVGGKRASCSLSSGTFTITLTDGFANSTPIVVVSPIEAGSSQNARVVSRTAKEIVVITETAAGVEGPIAFHALILGWRNPDLTFQRRSPIVTPRLKPRIASFKILNTAGVPSVVEGEATVTDNGTGDWTITFKDEIKPVCTVPIVVVSGVTTRAQLGAAPTESGFNVLQFSNAGVAADGTVYAMALMFDYADEF